MGRQWLIDWKERKKEGRKNDLYTYMSVDNVLLAMMIGYIVYSTKSFDGFIILSNIHIYIQST